MHVFEFLCICNIISCIIVGPSESNYVLVKLL